MQTRALLQRLDGIRGQVVVEKIDNQKDKSGPRINVDANLKRGVAFEK